MLLKDGGLVAIEASEDVLDGGHGATEHPFGLDAHVDVSLSLLLLSAELVLKLLEGLTTLLFGVIADGDLLDLQKEVIALLL